MNIVSKSFALLLNARSVLMGNRGNRGQSPIFIRKKESNRCLSPVSVPGFPKTAHAKTAIQRQIDATDNQIDRLVYELYELTDDEITIVEQGART